MRPTSARRNGVQGKKRTAAMCRARYEMLLNAGRGAGGNGHTDALGVPLLRAELAALVQAHSTLKYQVHGGRSAGQRAHVCHAHVLSGGMRSAALAWQ